MMLTSYSVIMSIVFFTIACTVCSLLLPRIKGRYLWVAALILVLCVLRCLVPLEFPGTFTINEWKLYPWFVGLMRNHHIGRLSIGQALLAVWGLGISVGLVFLAWKLIRHAHLLWTLSGCYSDERLSRLAGTAAGAIHFSGKVAAYMTAKTRTPLMAGFFRPVILFPISFGSMSDQEIDHILRHEIGHFMGRDLWIKLAVQLLLCLLWWNPAVYLFRSSMNQLLELRSDQRVCRSMVPKEQADYTAVLLKAARAAKDDPGKPTMSGFIGRTTNSFFRQRIHLLLSSPVKGSSRLAVVGIVLCLCLYLGSYTFIVQPASPSPQVDEKGNALYVLDPENSFLVPTEDGRYEVWIDGKYIYTISYDTAQIPPFNEFPVKK